MITLDELRTDAQCVLNFQTIRILADQPEFQSDTAAKRLAEFVLPLTPEATNHEGRDGYALVDAAHYQYLLARSAAIG